jgi:hypothetical protein
MAETTIRLKPGIAAAHYRLSTQVLMTGRLTKTPDNGYRNVYEFKAGWLGVISLAQADFEIVGEATR